MGNRRKARERALQALFFVDMSGYDASEALESFRAHFNPPEIILPFFLKITNGVVSSKADIDNVVKQFSQHWKISRMSCVDRNIIRMAIFEMLCCEDIPAKVSINEAIEIGKKFGTEESGSFINGILDSVRLAMEKEDADIKTAIRIAPTN
jgi:transcription antitermination protein NusB